MQFWYSQSDRPGAQNKILEGVERGSGSPRIRWGPGAQDDILGSAGCGGPGIKMWVHRVDF